MKAHLTGLIFSTTPSLYNYNSFYLSFFSPHLLSPSSLSVFFSNPLFIFHSIPFFSQLTSQLH
jgi:hypothetical protein